MDARSEGMIAELWEVLRSERACWANLIECWLKLLAPYLNQMPRRYDLENVLGQFRHVDSSNLYHGTEQTHWWWIGQATSGSGEVRHWLYPAWKAPLTPRDGKLEFWGIESGGIQPNKDAVLWTQANLSVTSWAKEGCSVHLESTKIFPTRDIPWIEELGPKFVFEMCRILEEWHRRRAGLAEEAGAVRHASRGFFAGLKDIDFAKK